MTKLLAKPGRSVPILTLAVIAIAIVSLLFYRHYRASALPEHAIKLDVTREQAAERSASFLRDTFQQDIADYHATTIWRVDYEPKTYLEKELGVERTAELADDVDLWDFWTRYFRPGQKEELRVAVGPDGQVVAYRHLIDEAAPGASLTRTDALQLAETARQQLGPQTGAWQLVDSSSTERPARRDWRFSWRRTDLELPATGPDGRDVSQVRYLVEIQGDQISAFYPYLQVPEAWSREYEQIRSANNLAQQIDSLLGETSLIVLALIVIVLRFARHDLRWRLSLVLAIVGGLLAAASTLNGLPMIVSNYDTQTSWEAFIGQIGVGVLGQGLYYLLLILLFGAAGEAVYRERFPGHLSLRASFSWQGLMSRSGAQALGLGSLLAAVMAAYLIVYYLAGGLIGFWTPADSKHESVYNTVAPWLTSGAVGYDAAIFEEFAFRLFAIPFLTVLFGRFLHRATLSQWLAIVVSAVIWAFLHSSYPQDPFYARGIELTLVGIGFGWLMVRFGILAPIAVHYTYDAMVIAAPLDNSGSLPSIALAYGLTIIPLALALVAVVRAYLRGGFVDEAPLLNGAVSAPVAVQVEEQPAVARTWRYPGLGKVQRRAALAFGAVGLVVLLVMSFAMPSRYALRVGADEAAAIADATLASEGIDPTGFQRVVSLESNTEEPDYQYLREHGGAAVDRALFESVTPTTFWQVRYLRPLETGEYRVYIRSDAEPGTPALAIWQILAEDEPGARLTADQARNQAEAYLQSRPEWRDAARTLVDETTIDRPNRTDYSFVFERGDARLVDATVRARVMVSGDRVSLYRPSFKVPEEFERVRAATSLGEVVGFTVNLLLGLLLLGLSVVAFLRLARQRALPIRSAVVVAGIVAVLELAGAVNGWPLQYRNYVTTTPMLSFLTETLAGSAVGMALNVLFCGVGWCLLHGLWRSEVGQATPAENRAGWAKETVLLSLALPLLLLGVTESGAVINASAAILDLAVTPPVGAGTFAPVVAGLVNAEEWMQLGVIGLISYLLLRRMLRCEWPVLTLGLVLALVHALTAYSLGEGLMIAAQGVSLVLLMAASTRWLVRANLAAYLGATAVFCLVFNALTLVRTTDGWLFGNGLALLAISAIGMAWFVLAMRRPRSSGSRPSALALGEGPVRPVRSTAA